MNNNEYINSEDDTETTIERGCKCRCCTFLECVFFIIMLLIQGILLVLSIIMIDIHMWINKIVNDNNNDSKLLI